MVIGLLLAAVLCLMWFVMAAPIGMRSISRTFIVDAPLRRVRSALHPFGNDFDWNLAVQNVTQTGDRAGKMITSHADRSGGFISRSFEIDDEGKHWTVRFTSDSSLAQSFWANHHMVTTIAPVGTNKTRVTLQETDSYRGIAFYVFRYFSMRRTAEKLKIWGRDGTFKRGGVFEKPITQFGMACLSAILLWPVFGLTFDGLIMSALLTTVVALHELGHIVAFRMMGHKQARMIFIPILGGIAMGGRPYDRHFEIGFSALMGAGFSAPLLAGVMWLHNGLSLDLHTTLTHYIVLFVLFGGLFNLGNLIPVWKFDGGQVLRQVFRTAQGQAFGAFVLLSWFAAIGLALGLPISAILGIGAVFAVLSVMTANGGIKPKTPLTPMTTLERVTILAAFLAVFSIHGSVLIWSSAILFA